MGDAPRRRAAQSVDEKQRALDRAPRIVNVRVDDQLGPERLFVVHLDVGLGGSMVLGVGMVALGAETPARSKLPLDADLRRDHELDISAARNMYASDSDT